MKKTLICSKCGDEFEEEKGRKAGKMNYCGYCEAVIFGVPQESFPPIVSKQEFKDLQRIRGAHITSTP